MRQLSRCPICGSAQIAHSFTHAIDRETRISVERCAECTHEFVNPQPDAQELQRFYADDYDSWNPERVAEQSVEREVEASKKSGLLRHVPIRAGLDVLDFGCGAGLFLDVATKLGANAMGIDFGKPNTERLKARGLNVVCGTLGDYIAQGDVRSFDAITSSHVFEHLHDPVENLRLLAQLLKPAGLIWIAVPNAANWGYRTLRGNWFPADLPRHLHHFTPLSLRIMVERSGLWATIRSESLAGPTSLTIREFLRHRLLVPQAISAQISWINQEFAVWLGKRLDRRQTGDALLAEIRKRPEAEGLISGAALP